MNCAGAKYLSQKMDHESVRTQYTAFYSVFASQTFHWSLCLLERDFWLLWNGSIGAFEIGKSE